MKILRQLLRRPLKTAAVFLLLSAAGAFLCLGLGVLLSANATREKIENNFVTIALPSNEMEEVQKELPDGTSYYERQSVISPEMWEELGTFPEHVSAVKGIYKQQFISAFCPQITTFVSAQEPGCYRGGLDEAYQDAVFVVKITEIADPVIEEQFAAAYDDNLIYKEVKGTIEQAVALHPGYEARDRIRLSFTFESEELFEAADLTVGGRYLVYGNVYTDNDLSLRTDIAAWKRGENLKPEDIDLSKVTCDLSEYEDELAELAAFEEKGNYGSTTKDVTAVYPFSTSAYYLYHDQLDSIGSCSLYVRILSPGDSTETSVMMIDGTLRTYTDQILTQADSHKITRLKGELSDFLSSEEGADWPELIEEIKIRQQCVPVLGTDLLESMYLFQRHEASIVEGRTFSKADYKKGNTVCLISEQAALAGGLGVGDTVELSYYWGMNPYIFIMFLPWEHNLPADEYSRYAGFLQDAPAEYEIIGVYRQADVWEPYSPYGFTPNTIFVPNASLPSPGYTGQAGVFTTFVLKNGGIDDVKAAIEEKGWPESTLLYYDSGYSEISGTLEGFSGSALWLFAASFLTWAAAMAVYLALFVSGQKRTAGLMLSLGAGKRSTERYLFLISMLPAAAAQLLGAVLGMLFLNGTLQSIFASAGEVLGTGFSGSSVSGHASIEPFLTALPQAALAGALLQAVLCAAAVFICAKRMAGTKPLKLLR